MVVDSMFAFLDRRLVWMITGFVRFYDGLFLFSLLAGRYDLKILLLSTTLTEKVVLNERRKD